MIEQKKKLRLDELQVKSFVTETTTATNTIQGGQDYYTQNFVACVIGASAFCNGVPGTIENCNAATLNPSCLWTVNVCTQSPEVCYPQGTEPLPV